MVLNKVNKSLVTLVEELGVQAVGVSGKDCLAVCLVETVTIATNPLRSLQAMTSLSLARKQR